MPKSNLIVHVHLFEDLSLKLFFSVFLGDSMSRPGKNEIVSSAMPSCGKWGNGLCHRICLETHREPAVPWYMNHTHNC